MKIKPNKQEPGIVLDDLKKYTGAKRWENKSYENSRANHFGHVSVI